MPPPITLQQMSKRQLEYGVDEILAGDDSNADSARSPLTTSLNDQEKRRRDRRHERAISYATMLHYGMLDEAVSC